MNRSLLKPGIAIPFCSISQAGTNAGLQCDWLVIVIASGDCSAQLFVN
jgi:hypothetical protein